MSLQAPITPLSIGRSHTAGGYRDDDDDAAGDNTDLDIGSPGGSLPLLRAISPRQPELGAIGVALFLFSAVAGGPYGIETAIQAAGAAPTFVALIFIAIFFCATQALIVAELASAYPTNAGVITWSIVGLGPAAGFVSAWISIAQSLVNMPLYAVLTANAINQAYPLSSWASLAVKASTVVIAGAVNVVGVGAAERITGVMVLLVQTPFIALPIVWALNKHPFTWTALEKSVPDWTSNTGIFLATVAWNMQGWLNFGSIAGEVKDPTRNIPMGVGVAVILVLLNYVWPLIFAVAIAPDFSKWSSGYFVEIAIEVAPGLGQWAATAAVLSCMSNFIPVLAAASRQTQTAAAARMLPTSLARLLARDASRFRTPVAAVIINAVAAGALTAFDFDTLVRLQLFLAITQLVIVVAAFVALKWKSPDARRTYAVPGRFMGACIVAIPIFCIAVLVIAVNITTTWGEMLILFGVIVLLCGSGIYWERYIYDDIILKRLLGSNLENHNDDDDDDEVINNQNNIAALQVDHNNNTPSHQQPNLTRSRLQSDEMPFIRAKK